MFQRWNEKQRIIVPVFFIMMLLIGILLVKDFGMPWDEYTEKNILKSNLKEYSKVLLGEKSSIYENFSKDGIKDISQSIEKDHGESFYYAYTPFLYIKSSYWSMMTWHIYTYFLFLTSSYFLYLIIKRLTHDWKYGILGCLFLFFSPRIFAEGFYNNKDIILMSGVILCIWFGIKWIDTKKILYSALFAIVGALTANTRIMGFLIFGLMGLLYILTITVLKEWSLRKFLSGISTIVTFFITFFLITPATWVNPVGYFQYVFTQSMNFVRWEGFVYYHGKIYNNALNPLPWHYLLVMFAVTTPILILLLIIIGHLNTIRNAFLVGGKGIFQGESKYYLVLILFIWIPVLYAILGKPTLYNGWRHFYFLYGPLLIIAVGAVKSILDFSIHYKWVKSFTIGLILLQFVITLVVMFINHPNEYAYYNVLAGKDIDENYEMDYWNISAAECLQKLVDTVYTNRKISVSAKDYYSYEGLYRGYDALTDKYKHKLRILEYRSRGNFADYWMANPTYVKINKMRDSIEQYFEPIYDFQSKCEEIVSVKAFGSKLMTIYGSKK